MGRKKVKLAFIAHQTQRNTTLRRRRESLLKKIEELSTLCGIDACAIVYSPNGEAAPEVWPSESGVLDVVAKFRSKPQWEQTRKMVNQESFLAQCIVKGKDKLKKVVNENKETEMSLFLAQCLLKGKVEPEKNMKKADFDVFSSMIEQNLKDISRRMEVLSVNKETPNQPQMQTPTDQPGMQTLALQPHMYASSSIHQPQMHTPPLIQPQMQASSSTHQLQMQTAAALIQSQMQTPSFQPQMKTPVALIQSQMQTKSFQPHMQASSSHQPQMQTPAALMQSQMQTSSFQPQMQASSSHQPQMQTSAALIQPQMQTLSIQPQMQTPSAYHMQYQAQMQASSSHQLQMQTLAALIQPQMQTPAAYHMQYQAQMPSPTAPDDMTVLLNYDDNESDMDADPMQSQRFVDDLLNSDGEDETTII